MHRQLICFFSVRVCDIHEFGRSPLWPHCIWVTRLSIIHQLASTLTPTHRIDSFLLLSTDIHWFLLDCFSSLFSGISERNNPNFIGNLFNLQDLYVSFFFVNFKSFLFLLSSLANNTEKNYLSPTHIIHSSLFKTLFFCYFKVTWKVMLLEE